MKTSRYTDSQIMAILKQAEAGSPATTTNDRLNSTFSAN
jgi:hypothetical protein